MANATEVVSLVQGRVRPDSVSAYGVVRNEMFFLPAFLEHYRRLGVEQFLFLDDNSDDGTVEFLAGQPDCVLLRSELNFGGRIHGRSTHAIWRSEIGQRFLSGRWAICADADEFLFLPSGFANVPHFLETLDALGATAVAAVMVDFYPETVEKMESLGVPAGRDELLACYPWFDSGPYFQWPTDEMPPKTLHAGVRERLFRKYDISRRGQSGPALKRLRHRLKAALFGKRYTTTVHKVPLVNWNAERFYDNAHTLNELPDKRVLLPLAHFKFTSSLYRKIEMATRTRVYHDASRSYFELADLLAAMKAGGGSFLGTRSVRFESVEDFERAGLLMFEPGG